MVRDSIGSESLPSAEEICSALDDPDCREIIRNLDEPMTASELSSHCDIPQSTLYRKLELLSEATLLREGTEIREDGSHASRYEVDFEEIVVTRDGSIQIEIERPARSADERLAEMWSEVRREL